ncbi:hypothetical protein Tco_0276624 [Tanacetum coccineum]
MLPRCPQPGTVLDSSQRQEKSRKKDEMPQNSIQYGEILTVVHRLLWDRSYLAQGNKSKGPCARGVEVRLTVEIVSVVPMCGDPLEDGVRCQQCSCKWCLSEGFCLFCASRNENSSIDAHNSNSFNDPPNVFTHPPQPQYESYSCELCGNDAHYGYDYPPQSSVEDLVPILSESKDTSRSDSECDLPSCNDFYPIDVLEGKFVIFSNPLFDSNDDFTSSDEESLSDEDVPEDNVKIYSNPLFEFDDEYISSDVNPLFDEVLEDIESKDSYDSNLDEPALLVTPLSDANEDECFGPGGDIDEIDAFLDIDVSTDIIYLKNFLIDDTIPNLPPREFLDYDLRSLKDEPYNDDLMTEDKVFDPGIHEKKFSLTYDYEDSRARGFVHRSLGLQSFACLYMGIRYPGYY